MSAGRRQNTAIINLPARRLWICLPAAFSEEFAQISLETTTLGSLVTQEQTQQTVKLWSLAFNIRSVEAGIMWNTKHITLNLDLKWLTYQLTKWVRLHMSQFVCVWKRWGETCVWLSTQPCDWSAYQTMNLFTPSPQSASTHGYSTPILHSSPPIRTFVHCYSNHGAHLGAHHVAMETASVYNELRRRGRAVQTREGKSPLGF